MRRRVIQPITILAVALVPACKPDATAKPEPSPSAAQTAAGSVSATGARSATPVFDEKVLALAAELSQEGRAKALARTAHYRPLCDDKGYPVVGNAVVKAAPSPDEYMPSKFCADLRSSGKP